jgi:hypothetical protein
MIEYLMLCGIGLAAGGLLMLVLMPFVHDRAVRLTRLEVLEAMPLAATEIRAHRDLLRAEFAMQVRQLEVAVERLRDKEAGQLSEIGRRVAEIKFLRDELAEREARIGELRTRDQARRSLAKRVARLIIYLFVSSNREERLPLQAMRATHSSMARMAERYAGLISL